MTLDDAATGRGPAKDSGKLPSLFWEDFEVGDVFAAPWGRTVTEAHVLAYSGVSGDFQHLHVDKEYAGSSQYGTRIAHGPLTATTGFGIQVYTQVWRNSMAFLDESHRYLLPVPIGDTLHSTMVVTGRKETRKKDRGVVTYRNDITNQDGDLVCQSDYSMMIKRR